MISIIIVNYRSWDCLSNCLDTLINCPEFEIIVVDNNSDDNIIHSFIKKYGSLSWIKADQNLGFGKACNLGAKNAKGEYLLFLNPDTIAEPLAIKRMSQFLQENSSFKIVSCQQRERIANHYLLFPSFFINFGFIRAIIVQMNLKKFRIKELGEFKYIEPDWVSGSVLMMDKNWFNKIQGWSEEFWMYSEDLDICKKTALQNGKIALLIDTKIFHKHGGATRQNIEITAMAKAEVIKSKHVYIQKYFIGISKMAAHYFLIISILLFRLPLAILGALLFFIPKLKMQFLLLKNLFQYYNFVLKNKNWKSERAVENQKK